nr:copper amine oxidase N-terminal domain-containing protein [uncultured Bacillus sp.]
MKKLSFIVMGIFLLFSLAFEGTVMADDDHEKEGYEKKENSRYEQGEHWEKSHEGHEDDDEDDDDDDDEEYEYKENDQISEYNQYRQTEQTGYWNIWTREIVNHSAVALPIAVPSNIKLSINEKPVEIYAVPRDGQLLISAEELAKQLDAKVKVYNTSKIIKITKNGNELIVRAASNVAYENNVKTPMPVEAVYYEKSVYIPICVLVNALGYRINWSEAEQKINVVMN